jgi:diaminopimelate decarboxylase
MEQKAIFLSNRDISEVVTTFGTPLYVYSRKVLAEYANNTKMFSGPYGTTIRYAVKANPHAEIISLFNSKGLHFDASSGGEVEQLIKQGIEPQKIALNSQELPKNLEDLVNKGVIFTATSLHQLETYAKLYKGTDVGVRLNPGIGSGETNKVTTGGVTAGFGIWHEYIPDIIEIAKKYNLKINKVHTHIGAGTDPAVWERVAMVTVELADLFENVTTVSLGGGFKVGRMDDEPTVDVPAIGKRVSKLLTNHAKKTGRKYHVEIEPGTYLTAMAGMLITEVIDITDTGEFGYNFIRTNTGMNDFLRPVLYGAQHPMWVVPKNGTESPHLIDYVVIGHNCESGDLLTPAKNNPDVLGPRLLPNAAIGDYVVIGGMGAYCASMRAIGYNSFESAVEVFV